MQRGRLYDPGSTFGNIDQKKGQSVALNAWMTVRDFDHKVALISWIVHDCAGLFESEQSNRFKATVSFR